jgi:hypothetical protein
MKPLPLPRAISVSFESDEEPLQKLRQGLRKIPDQELIAFGKAARSLCRYSDCPETFKRQLDEARAEKRRRHTKTQDRLGLLCNPEGAG